ncbi:Na+-dependent transporter [Pseudorhodoplanes sp.]|uniref:Na+-dependent transporter n=1 Tax=Pseudorhodoplanes sp. TaxID=1934341 RepID=UPI002C8ED430|nr:Na+-dependent transporter [Pseudorhodoplanes sp.]HWV53206.1 Na+-dependent transporter [Pseudorhodoplanes sp.]
MPIFDAGVVASSLVASSLGALSWLGRQGTRALALSVFVGIALPLLAAVFKHVFLEALLALLTLAFLRVDPASLLKQFRRPGLVIAASLWTLIAVPALMCGVALAFGLPVASEALFLALVLQAVAPPIIGSPALAALMGLDAALSLATLIVATASTPLTVPLLASLFAGPALEISPFWLGIKLLAMLAGTAIVAYAVRRAKGADWVARHSGPIDGLSVIVLFVFAIGLMDGVGRHILTQPLLVGALTLFVYALSMVLIVMTCVIFHKAGRSSALALGLAVGSRNMGLMVGAAGSAVPELTWLYFAVAQFPIYTLPHALRPLIHRWIEPRILPPGTSGVRRGADQ